MQDYTFAGFHSDRDTKTRWSSIKKQSSSVLIDFHSLRPRLVLTNKFFLELGGYIVFFSIWLKLASTESHRTA